MTPGHEMLEAERVVAELDDVYIVEKLEEVDHIVMPRDPRSNTPASH